eukprot:2479034-Prymnesium_polylepis.2
MCIRDRPRRWARSTTERLGREKEGQQKGGWRRSGKGAAARVRVPHSGKRPSAVRFVRGCTDLCSTSHSDS